MYTLVSAPVLGFDLVRRPGGHRVANVLVRALAADAEDLTVLAEAFGNDDQRDAAWLEVAAAVEAEPRVQTVMREMRAYGSDPDAAVSVARTLGGAALGSVDGLLTCLRHEVFDWTWHPTGDVAVQDEVAVRAAAVTCDAAAAAFLSGALSEQARRRLGAPWVTSMRRLPERRLSLGPCEPAVEASLGRLSRLTLKDVARLRRGDGQGERIHWSRALHSASWAVHLTDRVRAAATAQMLAVEALHRGGLPPEAGAFGAWNTVSGHVQAVVVGDLLDEETRLRLSAPFLAALGPAC